MTKRKYCGNCRSYHWDAGGEYRSCWNKHRRFDDPYPWDGGECPGYAFVGKRDKRDEQLKAFVSKMEECHDKVEIITENIIDTITSTLLEDSKKMGMSEKQIVELYLYLFSYSFPFDIFDGYSEVAGDYRVEKIAKYFRQLMEKKGGKKK